MFTATTFLSLFSSKLFKSRVKISKYKKFSMSEKELSSTAQEGGDTIFGKIIRGEIPTKFVYQDDQCVAFNDISPVADKHILIVPRKPISRLSKSTIEDEKILGHLLFTASKIAKNENFSENGYRIVINDGKHGCQSVYHLHVHLIGGNQLGWPEKF